MGRIAFASFLVLILAGCTSTPSTVPAISLGLTPTFQPMDTPTPPPLVPLPSPTPTQPVLVLQRGVNMSNALEAPREGDWGLYIYEDYFDLVRESGFDFVRLPVTWNGHAEVTAPYTIDPAFFFRVDQVVEWALERDLRIIIELHSYGEMMTDPRGNHDRFMAIWGQVAEHYKEYPSSLVFELLNEPSLLLDASLWNEYLMEALAIIRQTNPTREVVIGSTHWSTHDWVTTLDLPEDPHIIVTFHYYSPTEFTTQGAEWVDGSDTWVGTTWDGTDDQKAIVVRNFKSVADWADRHHVSILLGEFGAYSKAPMDSRARWTTFVREQAEAHGFAWAYWEFGTGFGVYDPQTDRWREPLLRALIP